MPHLRGLYNMGERRTPNKWNPASNHLSNTVPPYEEVDTVVDSNAQETPGEKGKNREHGREKKSALD